MVLSWGRLICAFMGFHSDFMVMRMFSRGCYRVFIVNCVCFHGGFDCVLAWRYMRLHGALIEAYALLRLMRLVWAHVEGGV